MSKVKYYRGRLSMEALTKSLQYAREVSNQIAKKHKLTQAEELSRSCTQLALQALNLVLSVQSLLEAGYAYGASVLIRPMFEYLGTACYLGQNPELHQVWENSWINEKGKKQPPAFKSLIQALPESVLKLGDDKGYTLLNDLIHANPLALHGSIIPQKNDAKFIVRANAEQSGLADFAAISAATAALGIVQSLSEWHENHVDKVCCVEKWRAAYNAIKVAIREYLRDDVPAE